MNLYTDAYAKLQSQYHIDRPDYGTSGCNYSDMILNMANKLQTRSIIDYGCGKCTLQKSLPYPIQNYDPFISEHSRYPEPADLVVCTDVMEHVEEEFVDRVLYDIHRLSNKAVFFQIATGPAKKELPDGRNAHITQHDLNWWLKRLMAFFDIKSIMDVGHGFVAVVAPMETVGGVSPLTDE